MAPLQPLLREAGLLIAWGGGTREVPDAFVLGVTEPTVSNTGPRVAEWQLENYAGSITTPGAYDRLAITGRFNVAGDWSATDCLILGGEPPPPGQDPVVRNEIWALVDSRSSATSSASLAFCELRPSYRSHEIYGLRGGNLDVERSKILGAIDAASIHGSGTYPANTLKSVSLRGCLLGDFPTFTDPNQGDNITHNDGIQAAGALSSLEIVGCSIGAIGSRPRTSTILLQKNAGPYGSNAEDVASAITITDNWLYGHTSQGSTFNMSESRQGGVTVGYAEGVLVFQRNRIDRAGAAPRILVKANSRFASNFGCTGSNGNTSGWVAGPNANIFMDDGTPVPINHG